MVALKRLLESGGILLSSDDELVNHVDYWLLWDPFGARLAGLLARQIEQQPLERQGLLERGGSGRIRDRVRAAHILGSLATIDEQAQSLLDGLLRDPIMPVWRAAARSFWTRSRGAGTLFQNAARCLGTSAGTEPLSTLLRHLAGGLAGLLPDHPEPCADLLESAFAHDEPWTRAAAALACGEAAVLAPRSPEIQEVCQRFVECGDVETLARLAHGMRDAGRAAERRRVARPLLEAVLGAVAQRTPRSLNCL